MTLDRTESKYIPVAENVELHILERGAGSPMLFIPGLTFSGEIFKAQIEHFSTSHRVIAIDPRAQGLSSKVAHGNDYLTHGRDLNALIEALDLHDLTLVGWSTGNLDLWSYVSQFGLGRLKSAVTIDMSPVPLSADPDWWVEASIEDVRGLVSQVLPTLEGTREFWSEYATGVMIQHEMRPEELEYLLDMSARTPHSALFALFASAIFSDYYAAAKEVAEKLPSLMFIAEHWADVAAPFMHKHFPGTKTQVMGGHLMFYEYPEKWNQVLEGFLSEIG
ncbi:MAG: alpha/beta hydrolase [Anaerolineales bacterium]|nr:alpha/beta hydrolase [Anaerolineales bacterium]